jgi:L-gulonate 3-dehydrogenase
MSGRVACIGAGTVGHAWAVVFARAGYEVALFDAKPGEVRGHALGSVRRTLQVLADGGMLSEPIEAVAARVHDAASVAAAVSGAIYVQESVREDVAVKRQVFAEIAAAAAPEAILASSTSAIKGSEFLVDIPHPERALVAHPVNPPSFIPLVELCGSGKTSPATIEAAHRLLNEAGMKPIVLNKEIDGFILNRLQYTLVAEALHLVGEGYCSAEDIDRVMTEGLALRWAFIGPFAVAHLNAVDGFQGFVQRLGPMMRRMGEDARTDYAWTNQQIQAIHDELSVTQPVARIAELQQDRDRRIVALRTLREALSEK